MGDDKTALVIPTITKSAIVSSEWTERAVALVNEANSYQEIDKHNYQEASDALSALSKHSSGLEKERKTITAPFTKAVKLIKSFADQSRDPSEQAKTGLKSRIEVYVMKQRDEEERLRREAEAKAQAETQKKLAEEEAIGELYGEGSGEQEEVVVETETVASHTISTTSRSTETIEWEIVDADKVPRALCVPDSKLINEYKKANKDRLMDALKASDNESLAIVDGIKFTRRFNTTSR